MGLGICERKPIESFGRVSAAHEFAARNASATGDAPHGASQNNPFNPQARFVRYVEGERAQEFFFRFLAFLPRCRTLTSRADLVLSTSHQEQG
jgi:hypothetical protein